MYRSIYMCVCVRAIPPPPPPPPSLLCAPLLIYVYVILQHYKQIQHTTHLVLLHIHYFSTGVGGVASTLHIDVILRLPMLSLPRGNGFTKRLCIVLLF